MVLDFKALLDPTKIQEAKLEREQKEREQANRDARTRAALAVLGRVADAGRLTDVEGRFVRQATARWAVTRFLTEPQVRWLMGLAERHSLILGDPAGSYIESDINGFVVRSARGSGGTLVAVPDVDALVELAKEEGWSERDIAAIQKRWGGLQTQGVASRFSFGLSARSSTQRTQKSPAELPARSGRDCSIAATERGHGAQAPRFQFGPAVQPTQGAEVVQQPPRRQRDGG